jgi:hypothetical protein
MEEQPIDCARASIPIKTRIGIKTPRMSWTVFKAVCGPYCEKITRRKIRTIFVSRARGNIRKNNSSLSRILHSYIKINRVDGIRSEMRVFRPLHGKPIRKEDSERNSSAPFIVTVIPQICIRIEAQYAEKAAK